MLFFGIYEISPGAGECLDFIRNPLRSCCCCCCWSFCGVCSLADPRAVFHTMLPEGSGHQLSWLMFSYRITLRYALSGGGCVLHRGERYGPVDIAVERTWNSCTSGRQSRIGCGNSALRASNENAREKVHKSSAKSKIVYSNAIS